MTWLNLPPMDEILRRREHDEPVDGRALRARVDSGELVRVSRGSYADTEIWRHLSALRRHAQRVWEAAARTQPGQVFSHFAAAALWDLDILGPWPALIDVTVDTSRTVRSTGLIRRHSRSIETVSVAPWNGHFVTTPLQTALDLISDQDFLHGVVVADRALWVRRRGGPLVDPIELDAAAGALSARGSARARRAAAFACAESDSVRESHSRVVLHRLGFPEPELQVPFRLRNGRTVRTDFFWREHRHIGEFDGVGKYHDPDFLRGRTPTQVLIDEKDREDELRRQVNGFSRWRTPDLDAPRRLYDILTTAGLPSSRPRPGR